MTTYLYTHESALRHDTGPGHPESIARMEAVLARLRSDDFAALDWQESPAARREDLLLVHPESAIYQIEVNSPAEGYVGLDPDTIMSPGSKEAAWRAVGGVVAATDAVLAGDCDNAFVAARPPGHHAEPDRAMGFCLFSNVAIAAKRALAHSTVNKIAVVDFDVHHGNGTQAALQSDANCFYVSSHQFPFYPGTGALAETGADNNVANAPLDAGAGSSTFRQVYEDRLLPVLEDFGPDMLFISAGFDAHKDDPLAQVMLEDDDYQWISSELLKIAKKHCSGRLVSALEGGYNLDALARCTGIHVSALLDG